MVQLKPRFGFQNHSNYPMFSAMLMMMLNKIILDIIFVYGVKEIKTGCLVGNNIQFVYLH